MCYRHSRNELHCTDCIIESMYGITIRSIHEVMFDGIINVFDKYYNSTSVTFNT
jgi:hypothetical protein